MEAARKISKWINALAGVIALYAALFYWTRGWIDFSPKAIPWLAYSLMPYFIFWVMSSKLLTNSATLARTIVFFVMASALLVVTAYGYLQFTSESLVFYLRQALYMLPAVSTVALLVFSGVGSLLTRPSSGAQA